MPWGIGKRYWFMSRKVSITVRQSLKGFIKSNLCFDPGLAHRSSSGHVIEQSLSQDMEALDKGCAAVEETPSAQILHLQIIWPHFYLHILCITGNKKK